MIPYDPTRQTYTNDLSRSDLSTDQHLMFEQARDMREMADAEVQKARDLLHAYGDARVQTQVDWLNDEAHATKAADAFAKLLLLVADLARRAYE
jgi:hypothetical protein